MDTNFENRLTYNGISFLRSCSLSIDEREIHAYHEILFSMGADVKISLPAEVLNGTPCSDIMTVIRIMENIDGHILFLLKKLCCIMNESPSDKQNFYAYSTFLMLLTELDCDGSDNSSLHGSQRVGELSRITGYISEHLSEDLTVSTLAQKMDMSDSGISHIFKREIGIPVHQYVTQRRLIFAQSLLLSGKKPSKIYSDCGYKDYSSFYKAYCLYFGYPPSSEGKERN